MKDIIMLYALRAEDKTPVYIMDPSVKRGLECGCICADCEKPVVAKHGSGPDNPNSKRPHFAHLTRSDCRSSGESALHKRAKHIIWEHCYLDVPSYNNPLEQDRLEFLNCDKEHEDLTYSYDVLAYLHDRLCIIEVKYKNPTTDPDRLERMREYADYALEVDIGAVDSQDIDDDKLRDIVLHDVSTKTWFHNIPAELADEERRLSGELSLIDTRINREVEETTKDIAVSKKRQLQQLENEERRNAREATQEAERKKEKAVRKALKEAEAIKREAGAAAEERISEASERTQAEIDAEILKVKTAAEREIAAKKRSVKNRLNQASKRKAKRRKKQSSKAKAAIQRREEQQRRREQEANAEREAKRIADRNELIARARETNQPLQDEFAAKRKAFDKMLWDRAAPHRAELQAHFDLVAENDRKFKEAKARAAAARANEV